MIDRACADAVSRPGRTSAAVTMAVAGDDDRCDKAAPPSHQTAIRERANAADGALDLARRARLTGRPPPRTMAPPSGSRRTGRPGDGGIPNDCTRVTHALFEQLQPFPAKPYSNAMKPVALPPGRARLSTKSGTDRIDDDRKHDRHGAGRLQQRPQPMVPGARMTSGAERDQFLCVSASSASCVASGPAGVDPHVAADRSSPIAASPCTNAPTRV